MYLHRIHVHSGDEEKQMKIGGRLQELIHAELLHVSAQRTELLHLSIDLSEVGISICNYTQLKYICLYIFI